jgi:UDP-N-acetylmuramoyl-L-alanyl-D-glutamate--2,6-diaminopimelate ligase
MFWSDVVRELTVVASVEGMTAQAVGGVQYDSRRVGLGDVFVAMRGGVADGNRYIGAALAQGAVAVVTDSVEAYEGLRRGHPEVGTALVERGRRGLAEAAAAVFGHPERALAVSAVTGTNGKTTTAYLLEQILKAAGRTCVLVGTIETHVGEEVRASPHTTPESRDLLETFADGVRVGATEAVMEMSSHALEQERVWAVPVDVGIFTNLTQDHLDYHGTMEAYGRAKARMFEGVGGPAPRVAVVNGDDASSRLMLESTRGCEQVWTYGVEGGSLAAEGLSFEAREVRLGAGQTSLRLRTPMGEMEVRSRLTGRVNVCNLVAAMAAAIGRGLTLEDAVRGAAVARPVPGRFETVANGLGLLVVVDYAHTEDALRNLIALARELVRDRGGRVITMFGCGGDRDRSKRPKMGRAVGEGSDLVVLTSDNPRSEAPEAIIADAMVGIRETGATCIVEEDRAGAIAIAIRAGRRGDVVLIAGKGHETVQIFADRAVPFDDVAVATGVVREMELG